METMTETIPKPLHTSWSLWEHQRNTNNNYDKNTCCIGSFSTIQDFWKYYNNYPPPTKIFYTNNYFAKPKIKNPEREIASLSLFRQGIEPKWEHSDNSNGGEFALRNFKTAEEIDKLWENLSIYCIGELFEHSNQITGIRIVDSSIPSNKKVLHRIEIWFKSLQYKDMIEKTFRKLLGVDPLVQIYFKEHSTAVETYMEHPLVVDKKSREHKYACNSKSEKKESEFQFVHSDTRNTKHKKNVIRK